MFEASVLIAAVLVNAGLGYVVYLKNPLSATNRLFLLLSGSFIAWSIVNYMSLHPAVLAQLTWIRLTIFFAALMCLVVFLTFNVFPDPTVKLSRRKYMFSLVATTIVMALTLTPLVFKDLHVSASGSVSPVPNPGIGVFMLLIVGLLGGGIWSLIKKYHHASGRTKLQLRLVLAGLAGTFSLIVLTIPVMVIFFDNSSFVSYGSAYTLLFSGLFAVAIVKHKLFDIKSAVARSLGYVMTLVTLSAAYIVIAFTVPARVFHFPGVSMQMQVVYALLALLMAFSFNWVKRTFNKLSNRYFYQDAYDPQELINSINRNLASTTHIDQLLHKTLSLLENSLKAEFGVVALQTQSAGSLKPRIVTAGRQRIGEDDIKAYFEHDAAKRMRAVTIADYVALEDANFYAFMNKNDVAVAARIGKRNQANGLEAGYILLGPKRSGNTYTKQDARVIEIVSNELVVAIQNALRYEEIERFNETLQQKVTDATHQLRESNQKLKILNETKDDFIGMASHQLRTPLTSVKGYLSLVIDGDAGKINETQKRLLTQAFTSSQRMVYLIADLLNVSRLRTGKFVIELAPTNIATMISDELSQLREMAASHNVALEYDAPKHFPSLMLDETKIRQVIMNFIDNAIYYTPSGGRVRVEVRDLAKSIELRVVDDGIGVPKDEQHHLFTKFYRAKNAQRARPDGTGLGLFMAKKVIVAQGGVLIFHSIEGQGSTFGFSFAKSGAVLDAEVATKKS